jgi:cobalamin-dependent methionine synthase I
VVGSEIAKAVTEKIHNEVENKMKQKGLSMTTRISPGYCGWDVAEQQMIFSLFSDNFCNIRLNESALMDLVKSVSGSIGFRENVRKHQCTCNFYERQNCVYPTFGRKD